MRYLIPMLGAALLSLTLWVNPSFAEEAAPPVAQPLNQVRSGFAFEASMGTGVSPIAGVEVGLLFTTITGGFMAGYKLDRVVFGLGFDVVNLASSHDYISPLDGTSYTSKDSSTIYLISPSIQVALLRSVDLKAEFFLAGRMGFGSWNGTSSSSESSSTDSDHSHLHIAYRLGPGVRYWVHPNIGIGFQSGLSGDHYIDDGGNIEDKSNSRIIGIYGSLGLLGVF